VTTDDRPDLSRSVLLDLRAGDPAAAEQLDRQFREPLRRFAQRYVGADAEDVVQEVFTRALTSDTLPDSFRAWLFRVARNVCLTRRRDGAHRDHEHLATRFDLPAEQTGLLTGLVGVEDHGRLLALLDRLSEAQREALLLRYLEGLGREEIAEVLDLEVSVVKSRLFEGVKRLRELAG
jgi:RNA polymerase sigma-70 factor (ECF subfamily)